MTPQSRPASPPGKCGTSRTSPAASSRTSPASGTARRPSIIACSRWATWRPGLPTRRRWCSSAARPTSPTRPGLTPSSPHWRPTRTRTPRRPTASTSTSCLSTGTATPETGWMAPSSSPRNWLPTAWPGKLSGSTRAGCPPGTISPARAIPLLISPRYRNRPATSSRTQPWPSTPVSSASSTSSSTTTARGRPMASSATRPIPPSPMSPDPPTPPTRWRQPICRTSPPCGTAPSTRWSAWPSSPRRTSGRWFSGAPRA